MQDLEEIDYWLSNFFADDSSGAAGFLNDVSLDGDVLIGLCGFDEVSAWITDHGFEPQNVARHGLRILNRSTLRAYVYRRDDAGRCYFDGTSKEVAHDVVETPLKSLPSMRADVAYSV